MELCCKILFIAAFIKSAVVINTDNKYKTYTNYTEITTNFDETKETTNSDISSSKTTEKPTNIEYTTNESNLHLTTNKDLFLTKTTMNYDENDSEINSKSSAESTTITTIETNIDLYENKSFNDVTTEEIFSSSKNEKFSINEEDQGEETSENPTTITDKFKTEKLTTETNESKIDLNSLTTESTSTISNELDITTETNESETIINVLTTENPETSREDLLTTDPVINEKFFDIDGKDVGTISYSSRNKQKFQAEDTFENPTIKNELTEIATTTETNELDTLINVSTDGARTETNELETISSDIKNINIETNEPETVSMSPTTESASILTTNEIETMLNPLITEDSTSETISIFSTTAKTEINDLETLNSITSGYPWTTVKNSPEFYAGSSEDSVISNINPTVIDTNTSFLSSTALDTTTTAELDHCEENVAVTNLKITPSPFSLQVEWSNPLPDCTFKYRIHWKEKSERTLRNDLIDDTKYIIEGLNACQEYTIYVQIFYNHPKVVTESNVTTAETISAVEDLNESYNEEENSLVISWNFPSNVLKCKKKYISETFADNILMTKQATYINNMTFYNINGCINNTYVITAVSETFESDKRSITYLNPKKNDPPRYNKMRTEIHEDYVITKWYFGDFICRPEKFEVECAAENVKKFIEEGAFNISINELSAKINEVEPYTNYSCFGIIINLAGESKSIEPGVFLTKSKPPEMPQNVLVNEYLNEYLNIQWSPPKKWNGIPENYNISVSHLGLNYNIPKNCKPSTFDPFIDERIDVTETEYNFSTIIIPASKYKITVRSKSDGGWSEENKQIIDLGEDIPETPVMHIKLLMSIGKLYNTSLNLTWNTPCKMNGKPANYSVILEWTRDNFESEGTEDQIPPTENWHIFENLKPDYKYKVQLFSRNIQYLGEPAVDTFLTPAGIPEKPNEQNLKKPNATAMAEPWKAVVYIQNDIFNQSMGDILYYAVIVAPKYCEETPKYEYFHTDSWPTVSSDNSTCTNENKAYEATQKKWNPFDLIIKSPDDYGTYEYVLGTENCTESNCNKPLEPNTEYYVKIRGFTRNGFRDTKLLYFITQALSDEIPVGLIIGLIVGILGIAFLIAAALFYTKGKINFKNWPRVESARQFSPAPLPVSIKKFSSHFDKMIENPGKIKNEFQLLSTISSDVTLSTKTALLPMNKKKNRYINILPYDQTRVKLIDNNTNSSDYINASFIKGYSGNPEFIASQGPTEATCPAFWQMILEQKIKLIVMLTQFVESGKDKCYKYFPDLKQEYVLVNDVKIQCVDEEILNLYNKREFLIIKGNVTKTVTHIQFNMWPDFGVPDEVHHMIDFSEAIKDIKTKKPGFTLVHCSAGVGRTGTLIAVDILLQTIRDKRKVDIFGTVLNLRKQRMNMVQSEKQYEFLYKCVYYVINNNGISSSPSRNLSQISESNNL